MAAKPQVPASFWTTPLPINPATKPRPRNMKIATAGTHLQYLYD